MGKEIGKIKDLLRKRKIVFLVFFVLISCQMFYSFLFPTYDASNPYWKTIEEMGREQNYSFDSFDGSLAGDLMLLVDDYHINSDCGGYILLAHDFPDHYYRGHFANLNRPVYPIAVHFLSLPLRVVSDSYALTFGAGIMFNFFLFFFAVVLFYLLVAKLISKRAAFLSSVLLIFSPFAHIWLVQPETNIFGAFAIIASLYLLYDYIQQSSLRKLILYSLAIGFFILGKMFFAISIFILLLAFYFKRFKEGILFFLIHLIPRGFWYLWVTKVFGITYFSTEIADFGLCAWLINIFDVPWQETFRVLLDTPGSFALSATYGFLLIPVIFALFGFKRLAFEKKNIICSAFVLSFFIFFLILNYYTPRHAFLMYPIIYPLAVLGIDRIADFVGKRRKWFSPLFYFMAYLILIVLSSVDIFKIFSYDIGFPWLE